MTASTVTIATSAKTQSLPEWAYHYVSLVVSVVDMLLLMTVAATIVATIGTMRFSMKVKVKGCHQCISLMNNTLSCRANMKAGLAGRYRIGVSIDQAIGENTPPEWCELRKGPVTLEGDFDD